MNPSINRWILSGGQLEAAGASVRSGAKSSGLVNNIPLAGRDLSLSLIFFISGHQFELLWDKSVLTNC